MSIARKPQRPKREASVAAVIAQGGSPLDSNRSTTTRKVLLRVPAVLLARIDAATAARPLPTPRTKWFLEAALEKLTREEGSS